MFRWTCMLLLGLYLFAMTAPAQTQSGSSGPYPTIIEGDPGVPGHTIYRAKDLNAFSQKNPMPVVAWGNGGCSNSSKMHENFLVELASHGFLVVAIGPYSAESAPMGGGPGGGMGGATKSAQLLEALDWATAENKRRDGKYFQKVDPSKFAAMGMSCGGLQALEVSTDPRVKTSVIMNSGILNTSSAGPQAGAPNAGFPKAGFPKEGVAKEGFPKAGFPKAGTAKDGAAPKMMMAMPAVDKALLNKLHAPIFYVIGGETDIAYPNANDDFAKIESVPVAMANHDVGHGGTYTQPNGGEFGKVAVAWLKWQLNKDKTAEKMFSGADCGLCTDAKWKLEKKRIP